MHSIQPICRLAGHTFLSSASALLVLAFLAFAPANGHSQIQEDVLPGLTGNDLLNALQANYSASGQLDYGIARDTMFLYVWRKNGKLACQYTDFEIDLPDGVDPTEYAFDRGINTEHLYPRSKGAGSGNANADMHHLYPTRVNVNGDRASNRFEDLDDSVTDSWYYLDQTQSSPPPASERDQYSESTRSRFEPREIRKGDIARAMMYFYTIYRDEAINDDPNFFFLQQSTFCDWNDLDPVDADEYARTLAISTFQGNKNPFVLDCTLANRMGYCPQVSQACLLLDNEEAAFAKTPVAFPNPTSGKLTFTDLPNDASLVLIDALGRRLETYAAANGNLQGTTTASLVLPKGLNSGCYTLVEQRTGWSHRILFSEGL
ncbi:MAG: endonuclease [Saprospiraceae bacterium]